MTDLREWVRTARSQYRALAGLSGLVLALTAAGYFSDPALFGRFLGDFNPVLVFLAVILLALASLSWLVFRESFFIYKKENLQKSVKHHVVITVFVAVAIFVDVRDHFPKEMNILFPLSLLFYPAIAFLVEIVFHSAPLWLLLLFFRAIGKRISRATATGAAIALVALLEPSFQVVSASSSPLWVSLTIWVNLYGFNLLQLFVFRTYDFFSMYLLRISYYLLWHLLWGQLRLEILFMK